MQLRLALAQLAVTHNISANVESLRRAINFARGEKAQLLLTPEGSLSGYTRNHQFDGASASQALNEVTALAREAGVGLALGTCFFEADGKCYNQLRFYLPDGTYLGFHGKILRCGDFSSPPRGEIEHYATRPLGVFNFLGIKIGGLICNDLWANPAVTPDHDTHLTQQLSQLGAQLILHSVHGGRDGSPWAREVIWPFHESNLRMRARAGKVWVATVDSCHPTDLPCSAPSGIVDPDGNWAARTASQGEQFLCHDVEL